MKLDARMTMFMTLVGVFLTCLIVGNLIGGKLTEVHLFGRTWIISVGEIPFPLTFILTDLINEFYGRKTARRVTLLGFAMIGLTVLIIQLADRVPFSPASAVTPASFANVFSSALTIQIASMVAFVTAQYVDIGVFFLIKKATGDRLLWLRATGSTAVSQLIDTIVIISIAFGCSFGGAFPFIHRSAMPIDVITTIILTSYLVKVTVAVLVTPVIYGLHELIERVWHLRPLPADVAAGDL